jgi:hypothetical protein
MAFGQKANGWHIKKGQAIVSSYNSLRNKINKFLGRNKKRQS